MTADDKLANANQWVAAARPIIRAMFAIEDAGDALRNECDGRIWSEAKSIMVGVHRDLSELIEGIRDDFLCDEVVSWQTGMTDAEAQAADELNDWVADNTTSVKAAIAAEIDRMNAEYAASWSAAA